MKVQPVITDHGERWIIIDSQHHPVEHFNRYLKFLDTLGRADNTLLSYARHLKLYGDYLELREIDLLKIASQPNAGPLDVLGDFLLWLQHPDTLSGKNILFVGPVPVARKPKTINVIIETVLSFYDYLARDGVADPLHVYREGVAPARFKSFLYEMVQKKHIIRKNLFHISPDMEQLEFVTPELYKAIIAECRWWRDKAIVGIMYEGGLRLGETLGLHLADLEVWDSKINIVPREGNTNRTHVKRKAAGAVYLPNDVLEAVSAYCIHERQAYSSEYLFLSLTGPTAGQPMCPDTVEKLFKRISKAIGVSVHPHMCRHGCATARLEAGWDELSIKHQLRHASLSSTRIYEHFRDGMLKEQSRQLYETAQKGFGWAENDPDCE